jgi:cellulose biosynthesis protein BcsQ
VPERSYRRSPEVVVPSVASVPVPVSPTEPVVLAVTDDPDLLDRLTGLAATAGVSLGHLSVPGPGWPPPEQVRLVLAGADADLPAQRRPGIVLVSAGEPPVQVWRTAVAVGAERVAVLPEAEPWLLERLLDAADRSPHAPILGVVGGRGGAGASTVAVAVAATAARDRARTLLVDADPYGGGLDLLVGLEQEAGLRWPDLTGARGRLQPGVLAATLPEADGLWVLSCDRDLPGPRPVTAGATERPDGLPAFPPGRGGLPAAAVDAVLRAGAREFDLVVVDLPRVPDPAALTAAGACRTVLLIVPAEVRATAAAGRVISQLDRVAPDQQLVVRGPAPTGLAADSVADALGLPLFGEVRTESAVAAALDRGEPVPRPRGSLGGLARRLLAHLDLE